VSDTRRWVQAKQGRNRRSRRLPARGKIQHRENRRCQDPNKNTEFRPDTGWAWGIKGGGVKRSACGLSPHRDHDRADVDGAHNPTATHLSSASKTRWKVLTSHRPARPYKVERGKNHNLVHNERISNHLDGLAQGQLHNHVSRAWAKEPKQPGTPHGSNDPTDKRSRLKNAAEADRTSQS